MQLLRTAAIERGIHIDREFIEVESAKAAGRTLFSEMVQYFKRNRSCRILLVEKTDRLYRNFADAITLEQLDLEIHFIEEGNVLSKDSKSQLKLMHDIRLAIAKNYVENQREEVMKGMHFKASAGTYPGRAPFGYRNNKAERTIEIDPSKAPIAQQSFEKYATRSSFPVVAVQRDAARTPHVHLKNESPQDADQPLLHWPISIFRRNVQGYTQDVHLPGPVRAGAVGVERPQPTEIQQA